VGKVLHAITSLICQIRSYKSNLQKGFFQQDLPMIMKSDLDLNLPLTIGLLGIAQLLMTIFAKKAQILTQFLTTVVILNS